MQPTLLPLPLLLTLALPLTTALSLPRSTGPIAIQDPTPIHPRDLGPIPIQPPVQGWPAPQSTIFESRAGGLAPNLQPTLTDCLTAFSVGKFYDGWDGNECGGMGWFKGTTDEGKVGAVECYGVCATYVLWMGVREGGTDVLCDYRKGMHGHCWMGYHPLEEGGLSP